MIPAGLQGAEVPSISPPLSKAELVLTPAHARALCCTITGTSFTSRQVIKAPCINCTFQGELVPQGFQTTQADNAVSANHQRIYMPKWQAYMLWCHVSGHAGHNAYKRWRLMQAWTRACVHVLSSGRVPRPCRARCISPEYGVEGLDEPKELGKLSKVACYAMRAVSGEQLERRWQGKTRKGAWVHSQGTLVHLHALKTLVVSRFFV